MFSQRIRKFFRKRRKATSPIFPNKVSPSIFEEEEINCGLWRALKNIGYVKICYSHSQKPQFILDLRKNLFYHVDRPSTLRSHFLLVNKEKTRDNKLYLQGSTGSLPIRIYIYYSPSRKNIAYARIRIGESLWEKSIIYLF